MSDIKLMEVQVESGNVTLPGILSVPQGAKRIVIFAHGSGSSRHSPRNQYVASVLHKHGLATLLFDLLTPSEEAEDELTREHRFNIPFLSKRLVDAANWVKKQEITKGMSIGFFGASTGGAAAINAATMVPDAFAVVSRGGRPDLASEEALKNITVPTLLIVGGYDTEVIHLNKIALAKMNKCQKELRIVPGATHLFEEPGTLELAAKHAAEWFSAPASS